MARRRADNLRPSYAKLQNKNAGIDPTQVLKNEQSNLYIAIGKTRYYPSLICR